MMSINSNIMLKKLILHQIMCILGMKKIILRISKIFLIRKTFQLMKNEILTSKQI